MENEAVTRNAVPPSRDEAGLSNAKQRPGFQKNPKEIRSGIYNEILDLLPFLSSPKIVRSDANSSNRRSGFGENLKGGIWLQRLAKRTARPSKSEGRMLGGDGARREHSPSRQDRHRTLAYNHN